MLKEAFSFLMLTMFLISTVTVAFNIQPVKAEVGLAESSWPMFGHDPQHTYQSPYWGAQTGKAKWNLTFAGSQWRAPSPAIDGKGIIYVGSNLYGLCAFRPDGFCEWNYQTLGVILSSAAIDSDGVIYFGSNDQYLYALYSNGTLKWKYQTGGYVASSPAIGNDGTIYVASGDSFLYAINRDGTLKWRYKTDWQMWRQDPTLGDDGTVYIGSSGTDGGYLYAINPDGTLKWKFDVGGYSHISPSIAQDGTIYINNGYLRAINPDGSLKWKVGSGSFGAPAIANDGTIHTGERAFHPDGTLKWDLYYLHIDQDQFGCLAIGGDGAIYIRTLEIDYDWTQAGFCSINGDGTLKWRYLLPIAGPSQNIGGGGPAIGADGTVYVVLGNGRLYAFGPGPTPPTPDFSIVASPVSLSIQQGSSGSSTITVTSINGSSQPVQLTVSGEPSGVTTTLNPQQVTPPAGGSTTSTLTVSVTATATPGNYTLIVTGISGTITRSTYVSLGIFSLKVGDWVQTTANLNVREGPGLGYTIINTMPLGTIGQIVGGPAEADGFVWWNISYNVGVTGWSAENWLELHVSGTPACVVELQIDGVEVSAVGVGELFDIYVGDSSGDVGITQVRFSNDNTQDGYPTGEWTDWYDWDVSSTVWDATAKIMWWAYFDAPGRKEVWVEVRDAVDQTAFDLATIFVPALALPVLTSPLVITPVKDMYTEGDSLTAEFTITNVGEVPITLDVLTVGGRLNEFIPPEGAPDFTHQQSVTLQPDDPYQYQGSLTLTQVGNYHFFVAYYIEDPTIEERQLLDGSFWNTCVDLGEGLTHSNRVKNIIVYEEGTIPEDVLRLSQTINREINRETQNPAYLIDPDVGSRAGSVWIVVSSIWTDVLEAYDELWEAGLDHDVLRRIEAEYARKSLDRGDITSAREHLQSSLLNSRVSLQYYAAAAQVYDRNMEEAIVTVKEALGWINLGLTLANPAAGKFASYVFMIPKFIAEVELVGEESATIKALGELAFKFLFSEIENPELGGRTLQNYLNNKVGKLTFPVLQGILNNEALQFQLSHALKRIVTWETGWLSGKILDELGKQFPSGSYRKFSPVELRVYDFDGKVTGVVNGSVRHEISRSFYRNGTITIFFPSDSCTCEVLGKEEGTYGLQFTHVEEGNITCFNATGIIISPNATHHYIVDWSALSSGEEGVTALVDADGDDVVDRIFSSDSELTSQEFIEKTSPTYPTHTLTVATNGDGTTFPLLGTYACSANSTVRVAAFPDEGYVLDYWELDSVNVGSNNPYTVLMQEDHTLNASFRLGIFDIAVTNVPPSKTVVGEGFSINTTVTVANLGTFTETLNVILFANDTLIGMQLVSLTNGTSTTITFTWNTTGSAKGNYTINAYACPITGETNTADNTYTGEIVTIAMKGDVNADDIVDIFDIATVALAFGSTPSEPNWNPVADINNDGIVDIFDIVVVALRFGETG